MECNEQTDVIRISLARKVRSKFRWINNHLKKLKDKPDASSQIHRAEITKLEKRKKDVSLITYLLNKFSWMLSKDPNGAIFNPSAEKKYNQKLGYQVNYSQIREMLLDCDPVIRTIICYREELTGLYNFTSPEDARRTLMIWCVRCSRRIIRLRSGISPKPWNTGREKFRTQ